MPTRRTRSADPPRVRQNDNEVPALREEVGEEEKEEVLAEVLEERELSSFEDVNESNESEPEQLELVTEPTGTDNMADQFGYLSNHLDGEAPPATILSVAEQLEGNIPFPRSTIIFASMRLMGSNRSLILWIL